MAVDPDTGELAGWERRLHELTARPRTTPPAPPPPPAEPRGVSLLRGAYGPWLAAQEMRKEMEGRP